MTFKLDDERLTDIGFKISIGAAIGAYSLSLLFMVLKVVLRQ